MKEDWAYKKLGEVATYINGYPFKPSDWEGIGKPIIRIQNLTNPLSGFNRCSRTDIPEKYFVTKGDVLISWSATLGVFEWESEDALLNQHIFKVVFDKADIDKQFYKYAVLMSIAEMAKHTNGATMKHIRKGDFDNIKIPSPPLSEQQSIVDYLDSAFAKIDAMKANAEKALNEAKALFQASLKEMLEPKEGWEEKKIKDICETVTDFVAAGSFASLRENVVYNSEKDYAQLVRTTDLKSKFSKGGYVYVNEHAFKYLYRVNLDEECIILPNVGVNCGEIYHVTPSMLPYDNNVLGPNAVLVRSKSNNNHFLSYLFLGNEFQSKLGDITSHMAQPKFNKTGLKEIEISVPPLSEQQSIVATLDSLKSKVDRLQENYDKISQECDALKQAILRQVFE